MLCQKSECLDEVVAVVYENTVTVSVHFGCEALYDAVPLTVGLFGEQMECFAPTTCFGQVFSALFVSHYLID